MSKDMIQEFLKNYKGKDEEVLLELAYKSFNRINELKDKLQALQQKLDKQTQRYQTMVDHHEQEILTLKRQSSISWAEKEEKLYDQFNKEKNLAIQEFKKKLLTKQKNLQQQLIAISSKINQ